jgi:hypothetical protein
MEDLLCGCLVSADGLCEDEYLCTSFCNSSATGDVGEGCAATQTCYFDLLRSANVHGCAEQPDPPGTKSGGLPCTTNAECRSGRCSSFFLTGQATYCHDWCAADAYCPSSQTVCRPVPSFDGFDAVCWPKSRNPIGTGGIGSSCIINGQCNHGYCSPLTAECTKACCNDDTCPAGWACTLDGEDVLTSEYAEDAGPGAPCSATSDCSGTQECDPVSGTCVWRMTDTVPLCTRDPTGAEQRPAGAACTWSRQCKSSFCDALTSTCIEMCCTDAVCPTGLTCELQLVETRQGVTQARICVNRPRPGVWLER